MKDKAIQLRPFHKRSVYLDLKGSLYETSLAADLKILGAIMVPMFNKDVSCVVSNRVPLKTKSNYWTPPTPVSPQNDSSMKSPVSNSPAHDGNLFPMSRGMALIQKATQKKSGTTDVLDVCKRHGIKVYPVDKMLAKVKQLKTQFTSKFAAEKKKANEKKINPTEKKLASPFIKLEDNKRKYKTHYKEFNSWGNLINPELSKKICELQKNFKGSGKLDNFARPALKEINTNKPTLFHKSIFSTVMNSSKTVSNPKFSSFPKASDSTSVYAFAVKKNPDAPSNVSVKQQGSKKPKNKKRSSYCEICYKYYTDLDEHLESQKHKEFMSNPINYLAVQNVISSFPKGDAGTWEPCGESLDFQSYLTDSTEIPMNCDDGLQMDFQTHYSNAVDIEGYMSTPLECNTELYSYLDPGYVSPSATTPETKRLGFLQDSFEEKVVEPSENAESCCKNLVQILDNEAMAESMSEVNGDLLKLLRGNDGLSFNFNCPNISRELLLEMNMQMFNTNRVLEDGCTEGTFNENLLCVENAEQVLPENVLVNGGDITPEGQFNMEHSGISYENNLSIIGCDGNQKLNSGEVSLGNLYDTYINCIKSYVAANPHSAENSGEVVKSILDTILHVFKRQENPGDIDFSGFTPKGENEDRVLCESTSKVENTDEIVNSTLNCILDVIEAQENLGNIGTSGSTAEVESKDVIFCANEDISIDEGEPTKSSKEANDVEMRSQYRDLTTEHIKDEVSAASLALYESEPLDLRASLPVLLAVEQEDKTPLKVEDSVITENTSLLWDVPPKLNHFELGSDVVPYEALKLRSSPPILVAEEHVDTSSIKVIESSAENTRISSEIPPKSNGSQLGSDVSPFVNSNLRSDGIATEMPTLIKSEFLSPSASSDELFCAEDMEDNAGEHSEWQMLHSQVSNLCEALNSSDES